MRLISGAILFCGEASDHAAQIGIYIIRKQHVIMILNVPRLNSKLTCEALTTGQFKGLTSQRDFIFKIVPADSGLTNTCNLETTCFNVSNSSIAWSCNNVSSQS